MKTAVLDDVTFLAVHDALSAAAKGGSDPVEELHRRGLLLTPQTSRTYRIQAWATVIEAMKCWTPADFLLRRFRRGYAASPTDMYEIILGWLEECLKAAQEGS
jgi:hypothetical protein